MLHPVQAQPETSKYPSTTMTVSSFRIGILARCRLYSCFPLVEDLGLRRIEVLGSNGPSSRPPIPPRGPAGRGSERATAPEADSPGRRRAGQPGPLGEHPLVDARSASRQENLPRRSVAQPSMAAVSSGMSRPSRYSGHLRLRQLEQRRVNQSCAAANRHRALVRSGPAHGRSGIICRSVGRFHAPHAV